MLIVLFNKQEKQDIEDLVHKRKFKFTPNRQYPLCCMDVHTHTHTHMRATAQMDIPPLLAALDLQWPIRLQPLMPRGACFTALPRGPNRLSISR